MDDDYTIRGINRGPGWWSVFFISLVMCLSVVSGLYGALAQGWIPMPVPRSEAPVEPAPVQAKAPETVRVPLLIGLPSVVAAELLKARGLRMSVQERRPDETLDADAVISQQPLAESSLAPDSPVVVVVSSGKPSHIAVPELVGRPLPEARQALEAAGLAAGAVEGPEDGVVKSSLPGAGEQVAAGGLIALVLEPAGVEVPQLVGLPWGRAKTLITKSGFKLGKVRERAVEERDAWEVLEQVPEAGQKLAPGEPIDVVRNESY